MIFSAILDTATQGVSAGVDTEIDMEIDKGNIMSKKIWDKINPQIKEAIIATFKMAGIDFEREYVVSEEATETSNKDASPWMTRAEAAKYAKCSTDTIDNWVNKGYLLRAKLDAGKPGSVLIDRASLERFLRSKIVNPKKRARKMAPSVPGGYRASASN